MEVAAKRAVTGHRTPSTSAKQVIQLSNDAGHRLIDVTVQHAVAVATIAPFLGDPFDRLLLAQAQIERLRLVTHDERLAAYDSRSILF
jgi:PIN domain nuclease of toxin-antitoxin system